VNNYNPGYTRNGVLQPLGPDLFTLPPQTGLTLAEALSAKGITWKYYSGGRDTGKDYCSICDPFTFSKAVMESLLRQNLQDLERFYDDIADEKTTPAVAFVRPDEPHAGHPANATIADFEDFVANLGAKIKSNGQLWEKSAILITMDEGGGYYDSGYIQTIDFFGDGTRIPLIVVSPYAKRGYVDHTYSDHASILKFIENNWKLTPLTSRSPDNLPNPITSKADPYVPVNSPAIGDLMPLFTFSHP
jgi:phospholipase C